MLRKKQQACSQSAVPNYGDNEEKYEIEEFEQPLLLFPIEPVEYLSDIYQVLPSHVPGHMEDVFSKVTNLTHSSISEHQDMSSKHCKKPATSACYMAAIICNPLLHINTDVLSSLLQPTHQEIRGN